MLGKDGGRGALGELVGGKIASGSLMEAFGAADRAAPSSISEETSRFAVGFGASKASKQKLPTSLRDSLKKKLVESRANDKADPETQDESRKPASSPRGELEDLTPSHDPIFASASESEAELTLFDVVHLKYAQLFKARH
jgi:hypothetical protein